MGHVYGEKLLYIECDFCDARIKPSPRIVESGWKMVGMFTGSLENGPRSFSYTYYCPKCASENNIYEG